jgi:hypothetical protein
VQFLTPLQLFPLVGWLLAAVGGIGVVYGLDFEAFRVRGEEPTRAGHVAYISLHRMVWGICVGWVVFACAKGYAGTRTYFQHVLRMYFNVFFYRNSFQYTITLMHTVWTI